jgi:hypothetical protein
VHKVAHHFEQSKDYPLIWELEKWNDVGTTKVATNAHNNFNVN